MIRVGLQVHHEVRASCGAETFGVRLRFDSGFATVSRENGGGDSAVGVVNLRNAKEHADVVFSKSWVTKRLPPCCHEGP